MHPDTTPPVGYIVWLVNGSFRLDIPGELDLVPYPTLEAAVAAAWGHREDLATLHQRDGATGVGAAV